MYRGMFFIFCFSVMMLSLQSRMGYAEEVRTLTWEMCVKEAEMNNPDIISAREKIIQTEADSGITRSGMLPQISASAGMNKTYSVTDGASRSGKNYTYGLNAKQLIFDGFKSWYDLKSADVKVRASRYEYISASAAVRLNVRTAFVDLIKAQEMVAIAKDIETRRKHIMSLVKIRYDAGSEHRGSYYSAKADYAQAQADTAASLRDLSAARRKLNTLVGLDEKTEIEASGKLDIVEKYDAQPDMASLAVNNPSVKKAVLLKESAVYDAKSAVLSYSPKIYGTASAERSGSSVPLSSTNYSIGINITAPLFEGGQTFYSNKKADSYLRQSSADEKSTRDTVMRSLDETWNSLKSGKDNVDVQSQYLAAALERSKIGEAQYAIGLLSFDNWTIIESNLVNAKKNYLEACAAVLRAEAKWVQSTGGALEYEDQK